jgi:hypothetical protein
MSAGYKRSLSQKVDCAFRQPGIGFPLVARFRFRKCLDVMEAES